MVNFRVRDLDAMLAQLHDSGIDPDDEVVEAAGVGRFAHVRDPAGTRAELWEPADLQAARVLPPRLTSPCGREGLRPGQARPSVF